MFMNQILKTNSKNINVDNSKPINSKKKLVVYKLQFTTSILLVLIVIIIYFVSLFYKNSKEQLAHRITDNYSILKLYNSNFSSYSTYNKNGQDFTVIGMIEIPKINVYYPIISEATDELLKISPCRVAGPMPNEDGNLCIAGHNYDNYKFFSKLNSLRIDDEIKIYGLDGNHLLYKITAVYEVYANDLSPLEQYTSTKKQVTLITCNNFNSDKRIIIEAFSNK